MLVIWFFRILYLKNIRFLLKDIMYVFRKVERKFLRIKLYMLGYNFLILGLCDLRKFFVLIDFLFVNGYSRLGSCNMVIV